MSLILIHPAPDSGWAGKRLDGILKHALAGREVRTVRRAEELDGLASRLAGNWEELYGVLRQTASDDYAGSWQTLAWAHCLAGTAVRTFSWKDGAQEGMELARIFARVEKDFITGCYAPEMLREGNLCILPPMHRVGWYCAQAFNDLEAGDAMGFVRLLRAGLASCESMKDMAEFLAERTPELQAQLPGAELRVMAEKIRMLLAAYPENDPAVAAIKQSPAYQRVAYLIEGNQP